MKGSVTKVLADVSDPAHPRTICTLTGLWQPQLVTASEISWAASQKAPGTPGPTVIATLDLFSGITAVVASWQGGGYLDGLHAWSPGRELLVYLTSDTSSVDLHLLSGGGDRVVANLGSVPGRGTNPSEDDSFLEFSPDGSYFAMEQTFTCRPEGRPTGRLPTLSRRPRWPRGEARAASSTSGTSRSL